MKRKAPWRWPYQFINVPPGPQADGHGAYDGGRRVDHHTEQLRAGRYDEPAPGRGDGEGHDGVCPYRPRRRGESDWAVVAADRSLDLWQCQSRHATDAIGSDHRDRLAAEGAGLAGYLG